MTQALIKIKTFEWKSQMKGRSSNKSSFFKSTMTYIKLIFFFASRHSFLFWREMFGNDENTCADTSPVRTERNDCIDQFTAQSHVVLLYLWMQSIIQRFSALVTLSMTQKTILMMQNPFLFSFAQTACIGKEQSESSVVQTLASFLTAFRRSRFSPRVGSNFLFTNLIFPPECIPLIHWSLSHSVCHRSSREEK